MESSHLDYMKCVKSFLYKKIMSYQVHFEETLLFLFPSSFLEVLHHPVWERKECPTSSRLPKGTASENAGTTTTEVQSKCAIFCANTMATGYQYQVKLKKRKERRNQPSTNTVLTLDLLLTNSIQKSSVSKDLYHGQHGQTHTTYTHHAMSMVITL